MTYPIIRWNGGGGGAINGNALAVKLGDGGGGFFTPLLLPLTVDGASVAASFSRARAVSTSSGSAPEAPSEETQARCRCVLGLAGDLPADLAASAMEACLADPSSFIASLGTSGLDTSSCSGAAADGSFLRNPWVIGGAAALVLGGLAYVALK